MMRIPYVAFDGSAPVRLALLAAAGALLAACGGPALLPGTRDCIGFPAEVCQQQVVELQDEGRVHGGVAAYRLVCTSGICTPDGGEGKVTVVFGDGSGREGGFGYAVPLGTPPEAPSAPDPPLSVTPLCRDVPQSWCQDFARSAADDAARGGQTVVSITVRCTTTCTATNGDVETRVTLSDGTAVTSVSGYRG
jgi:hypothetical protein